MKNILLNKEGEEMFAPWITIPADDVRVQLPMSIFDGDIKIMFRNAEVIDKTIEQMENLKELMREEEGK
jgi:hypothetical protein